MRIRLTVKRNEDGAIAIVTALLAVSLIVVAAFTTDFGMAYSQRQAFAAGADSAALAVIRAEYDKQMLDLSRTCESAVATDAALATSIAFTQVTANKPFNEAVDLADVDAKLKCDDNVLKVSVVVTHKDNPIFGGVAGAGPMDVGRTAVAALGVVNGVKVLPVALCAAQADTILKNPDSNQLVELNKIWPVGSECDATGGNGNWGWLKFGTNPGNQDLIASINGTLDTKLTLLPGPPSPHFDMPAKPGSTKDSQVTAAIGSLMGSVVIIPVYSTASLQGAGTTYTVTSFLTVQLCGYSPNNAPHFNVTDASCYSALPAVALKDYSLQVRLVKEIPNGDLGTVCPIGSSCANNSYVYKLIQ